MQTLPTTFEAECIGCFPERPEHRALCDFWAPAGQTCPAHHTAPAQAVAARIQAGVPAVYAQNAGLTVRITRGEITVTFNAHRLPGRTAAHDMWDTLATLCGIPTRPEYRNIQDNQVKAKVAHGWADPGMDRHFRQGVPVRLVAHGWTRMEQAADKREAERTKFLASLPARTVPAQGGTPGYTVQPIEEGAILPAGDVIVSVEDPNGSSWIVDTDADRTAHIHKHAELRQYTTGRVVLLDPPWAGWSS